LPFNGLENAKVIKDNGGLSVQYLVAGYTRQVDVVIFSNGIVPFEEKHKVEPTLSEDPDYF
jgi:hypothetical protein